MTRHETDEDRILQARAIAAAFPNHTLHDIDHEPYFIDYGVSVAGKRIGIVEVKVRGVPGSPAGRTASSETMDRWGTTMVDELKWNAAQDAARFYDCPFGLLIGLTDGLYIAWWEPGRFPLVEFRDDLNRSDRDDPNDDKRKAMIPWGYFDVVRTRW